VQVKNSSHPAYFNAAACPYVLCVHRQEQLAVPEVAEPTLTRLGKTRVLPNLTCMEIFSAPMIGGEDLSICYPAIDLTPIRIGHKARACIQDFGSCPG
jgi:hypothetical protein